VELVHLDGFITKKKPIYRLAPKKMYTHCTLILMGKECIHLLGHSVYKGKGKGKGKGKAVPLQAWSGPEVSRKLRFSDFMTTAQDGVKFVSLRHRPP
jgi:hypothetical protein